ncbi:MAG: cytochrome c oxidase subunit II [Actinomycetales bacterium]
MRAGSPNRRRIAGSTGIAAATALLLSGCSGSLSRGLLPKGVTENSKRVTDLWNGSWIAALGVGVLVWGLTIWCVVAYRRRKDDPEFPEQLRYNVPIEILYTVVPLFMIGVLFYFTARDEEALLSTSAKPDLVVNVVGKQWSWDFNYVSQQVYEVGTQAELTGKPLVASQLPTLYLPVDKRVEFTLTARDVIHSFWVPAFLQKLDVIPGRVNRFQVVPTTEGTFAGKCAELCGSYHSAMLFQVKVVSQSDFDAHIKALQAAGQTGQLPNDLNRSQLEPGQQDLLTGAGSGS